MIQVIDKWLNRVHSKIISDGKRTVSVTTDREGIKTIRVIRWESDLSPTAYDDILEAVCGATKCR